MGNRSIAGFRFESALPCFCNGQARHSRPLALFPHLVYRRLRHDLIAETFTTANGGREEVAFRRRNGGKSGVVTNYFVLCCSV